MDGGVGVERDRYTSSARVWPADAAAADAVRAGNLVFVGGRMSAGSGSVRDQAEEAFGAVADLLAQAGGGFDDVVDLMSFHTDARDIPAVLEVGRDFFQPGREPAWTPVGMVGAPVSEARVVLRAVAVLGDAPKRCTRPEEPDWWTPYPVSAACGKDELVFVAGQGATGSGGQVAARGDHAGQARVAFGKVAALVEQHGGSLADVIDFCSFHHDARGMAYTNAVFEREVFGDIGPGEASALTTIGSPGLIAPGMLCQYRAIADLTPGTRLSRTPDSVWWHDLPVSGVTRKPRGRLVGISGQVASDGDGEIVHAGDPEAQARYAFEQIHAGLEMLGGSIRDVVEITAFHKDPRDWRVVAEVGREFFTGAEPAWTSIGTTGLFNEGYLHEIHALAVIDP
jgi:enamine deaminase RidA (YjgF/YER057c/UK114 family)